MSKQKYELGDKVKDQITGITGIVTSISFHLTGCIRYAIQPPVNPQTKILPDSIYAVEPKMVKKQYLKTPDIRFSFFLGDQVKDLVTGKKFIIYTANAFYEGYVNYRCRLEKPKDNDELSHTYTYEEAELELVSRKKLKTIKDIRKQVEKINPSPVGDRAMSK